MSKSSPRDFAKAVLKHQEWDTTESLPYNQGFIQGFLEASKLFTQKFECEEKNVIGGNGCTHQCMICWKIHTRDKQ